MHLLSTSLVNESQPVVRPLPGPEQGWMPHRSFLHDGYESNVLFHGWDATDDWLVGGTVAAVFFISFLFEFVRCARNRLLIRRIAQKRQWTFHVITSVLYGVQAMIGIMMILLISSFHVWICVAVASGLTLGCLCFSVTSVSLSFNVNQEHCL